MMDLSVILAFGSAALAFAVAITVYWSNERSAAHRLFIVGMLQFAVERAFCGLATYALLPQEAVNWELWRMFLLCTLPGTWITFSQVYARGSGQDHIRSRWWVMGTLYVLPIVFFLFCFFFAISTLLTKIESKPNALGWAATIGGSGFVLHLFLLVSVLFVLINLERTFRASVGTMRWRIKFMVLGLAALFTVRAYSTTQVLLFQKVEYSLQGLNSAALIVGCLLIIRSLSRAGHFDVRVYPSQAVLQHSLSVLLAGSYLVIVGVFAKLVDLGEKYGGFQVKAFVVLAALVLLSVLLLSDKVRLKTRRFVSRHFQRPFYDYRTVWRTFTEATARRVEQKDLCEVIAKLVSEVFQALSVTIWLLDERKANLVFATSTSLFDSKAREVKLEPDEASGVIQAMVQHPDPIDVDQSREIWAALLRRLHPDEFREGGNRICVPMLAGGELLGVMMLGDRVGGVSYTTQDFDLLKSVTDQTAASLLNIQLSQRLAQAKQLEAFQAMSAFFVHDLKNTASTMSLMLQNLPVHFNDPAFREDALRGVGKTVAHINDLISRLSMLRQELVLNPVETDLNQLVSESLKTLGEVPRITIKADLRPLPKSDLDPEQIQTVLTNLVLNARDAIKDSGEINVRTEAVNGSVVLSVSDTGCGMPQEFIEQSLFRPFKTTKKRGIGIGMFQCRRIVEAHRGRIEVQSTPSVGTTFKVILPLHKRA